MNERGFMVKRSPWGQAVQLDQSTGLWYKFRQNPDGSWEILCSGDRDSLDRNSVVSHDHYWQKNGLWYFQGKLGDTHTIGRDAFLADLRSQNQNRDLNLSEEERRALGIFDNENIVLTDNQIKSVADRRANQAYGSAGYVGNNHGIEVSSFLGQDGDERIDKLVAQYQQLPTQNLVWRDTVQLATETPQQLSWRNDSNSTSLSNNVEERQIQGRRRTNRRGRK